MKYQFKPFTWSDEVREIEVRTYWGCYEKRSDKSLTIKAERFVKAMLEGNGSTHKQRKAGMKFAMAWRRMCRTKTHRKNGVGDTAVRENVWDFLESVCKKLGHDYHFADTIWNEAEELDWEKEKALKGTK